MGAMFVAAAVGLVELIAKGYRVMAIAIIAIFMLPLCTIGIAKLRKRCGA